MWQRIAPLVSPNITKTGQEPTFRENIIARKPTLGLWAGYDVTSLVTAGLEYYGGIGPVTAFDPVKQQQHLLFPALDLNLGPRWEFNFGVGFGLTPSTDRLLLKLILGYRFNVGAGSRP